MQNFAEGGAVGRWWVDIFPILDILPRYFAEWKKISTRFHKSVSELHITNLKAVWEQKGWNWAKLYKDWQFSQRMADLEVE